MSRLGRVIAVLCGLWVAVSIVMTLWARPEEALAFASFCVAVTVIVPLAWRFADPSPNQK